MQARAHEATRAEALTAELNRRWKGHAAWDVPNAVIEDIKLLSPPAAWPPRLLIRGTVDGETFEWADEWDSVLWEFGPIEDAATHLASVAWVAFPEIRFTGSRRLGFRFLGKTG